MPAVSGGGVGPEIASARVGVYVCLTVERDGN